MIKKIVMYLSTYIPIAIVICIKDFIKLIIQAKNEKNFYLLLNYPLIIVTIVWILIGIIFTIFIMNNKKLAVDRVVVIDVKNKTAEYYTQYFSMFVLSLIGISFINIPELIAFFSIIVVLGVVYIKNDLFYINPTINLFNSFVMVIEYEQKNKKYSKTVICKKKINVDDEVDLYVSDYNFTFIK